MRNTVLKESSKFARNVGEVFDYEEAEKLAFEYLGEPIPTKTNLVTKPLLDKEKEEIFDLMGEKMLFYSNELTHIFSVFENDEEVEDKDLIINQLIKKINDIENTIIDDSSIEEWQKTTLLTSSLTAKSFVASFKELTKHAEGESAKSQRFFKRLWKGVKKVARATASVVVKVVATTVRTIGFTFASAIHGIANMDGKGMLGAAVTGSVCAVGGALSGFFGGIVRSFKCGAFDFRCVVGNIDTVPCAKKPDFQ
ncbi:hypothetical protein ACILE9_09540 [Capnocytophaga cynodegmi]|uniref:hypothetical protein n=1 Tax=Capnocytophaga cynodegmi TaxID=28189 RepID=UPI0037D66BD4